MKGRIIGALWIIAALSICYFCLDGILLNWLLGFCFLMAIGEIIAVTDFHSSQMQPKVCPPRHAWALQELVLLAAMLSCAWLTPHELALIILTSALSDTGAFTVGKLIGKHRVKAFAKISPNKTYEGYLGGAILPLLALVFCPLFGFSAISIVLLVYVILSGLVAEAGDLLGSATKRQLGVKDSGTVLTDFGLFYRIVEYPLRGHGGYLDRIDSLSLCVTTFAIIKGMASLL